MTTLIMGGSTFLVGVLPNRESWVIATPVLLIALRMLQGLALGGEYGGVATYVAEHAPHGRRGCHTTWIQAIATLGLLLSLVMVLMTTSYINGHYPDVAQVLNDEAVMGADGNSVMAKAFAAWGWRIPFIVSVLLLIISMYIQLTMVESQSFKMIREEGTQSKAPPRSLWSAEER